jgi:hypothetical protein
MPGLMATRRRGKFWLVLACAALGCSSSAPMTAADGATDLPAAVDAPAVDGPATDVARADAAGADRALDGGAPDGQVVDGRAPDGGAPETPAACSCAGGCGAGERCLQNQFGGVTPTGVQCQPRVGVAECRPICAAGCPTARPHCVSLTFSSGCCSDAIETVPVCCANADAHDVSTCL